MKSVLLKPLGQALLDAALKHAKAEGNVELQALIHGEGAWFLELAVAELGKHEHELTQHRKAVFIADLAARVSSQFQGLPPDVVAVHAVELAHAIVRRAEQVVAHRPSTIPAPPPAEPEVISFTPPAAPEPEAAPPEPEAAPAASVNEAAILS